MAKVTLNIPGLSGGGDGSSNGDDPQQQGPPAPPPPPPPPPLNFAQFAANPMNQQKIQAMIPGLQPPPSPNVQGPPPPAFGPAPAMPSLPSPSAPQVNGPPIQSRQDWQQQNSNLQEHPYGGVMKALQIAAGLIGGGIPGGVEAGMNIHRHDLAANLDATDQQRYEQAVVQPYTQGLQQQDIQAQMQQRQAMANKSDSQADAYSPQTVTPEQAAQMGMPQLSGVSMSGRDLARLSGVQSTNQTKVTTTGMKTDADLKKDVQDNTAKGARQDQATKSREGIATAANKTRLLLRQMQDNTSSANSQRAHDGGSSGNHKVPADVTKRAALASNVTENANSVDQLLARRPDIVGAAGGRYTSVQQMIGSNDPDIAELGVRMHNIALASNGAHGVRAQQAIEQTENELMNHFKTGPQGIHSALNATRSSMQTFLDDEKNFSQSGQRTAPPSGGSSGGKTLDRDTASKFLQQAGGDKNRARQLAKQAGY